jgi:hypothetical protein
MEFSQLTAAVGGGLIVKALDVLCEEFRRHGIYKGWVKDWPLATRLRNPSQ